VGAAQRVAVREHGPPRSPTSALIDIEGGSLSTADRSVVLSAPRLRLQWRPDTSVVGVLLGEPAPRPWERRSRWQGWGLTLWDPEMEAAADAPTRWSFQGAKVRPLTEEEAAALPGARVRNVAPLGATGAAGVLAGDRIVTANGTPIRRPEDLWELMTRSFAGQQVSLELNRGETGPLRVVRFKLAPGDLPRVPRPRPAGNAAPKPVFQEGKLTLTGTLSLGWRTVTASRLVLTAPELSHEHREAVPARAGPDARPAMDIFTLAKGGEFEIDGARLSLTRPVKVSASSWGVVVQATDP